jgi:hypothetical protein
MTAAGDRPPFADRWDHIGRVDPHEQALGVRAEALGDSQPRSQTDGIGVAAEQRNQNHP